jgi:hypothetical protein
MNIDQVSDKFASDNAGSSCMHTSVRIMTGDSRMVAWYRALGTG